MIRRPAMGEQCEATILQKDDRWGGFVDRCDLPAGHPGPHVVAREGCEPVGWLSWWSDPPGPGPAPPT